MGTQGWSWCWQVLSAQLLSAPSAPSPGTELLCIPWEHCFPGVLNVTRSGEGTFGVNKNKGLGFFVCLFLELYSSKSQFPVLPQTQLPGFILPNWGSSVSGCTLEQCRERRLLLVGFP